MPKQNIKDFRQQFIDQGYTTLENVLTTEEAKEGATILLDKIRPEPPQSLMPTSEEHDGSSSPLSMVFLKSLDLPHIQNCWM